MVANYLYHKCDIISDYRGTSHIEPLSRQTIQSTNKIFMWKMPVWSNTRVELQKTDRARMTAEINRTRSNGWPSQPEKFCFSFRTNRLRNINFERIMFDNQRFPYIYYQTQNINIKSIIHRRAINYLLIYIYIYIYCGRLYIYIYIIKGFRTIVIIIISSTTFRSIYIPAFFRCLSNSGTFTELRTTSFTESTGVTCSDSVSHNRGQVSSIPVLLSIKINKLRLRNLDN